MSRQKGVVLQVSGHWATILLDNGEYRKILRNDPLYVGQEISISAANPWKYAAVAAIFILVLIGTMDFFTVTTYARLSSGIEVGINRWERVVYVRPLNSEGQETLQGLDLQGRKVEKALNSLLEAAYHNKAPEVLTISVRGKNQPKQDLERRMVEQITREILQQTDEPVNITRKGNELTIQPGRNHKGATVHRKPDQDSDQVNSQPEPKSKPPANSGKPKPERVHQNELPSDVKDIKQESIKNPPNRPKTKPEQKGANSEEKVEPFVEDRADDSVKISDRQEQERSKQQAVSHQPDRPQAGQSAGGTKTKGESKQKE